MRVLGYGNRTPRCFVDSQSTGRDCGAGTRAPCKVRPDLERLKLQLVKFPIQSLIGIVWFTSSSGANDHLVERISRVGVSQVVRKRRMPCLSAPTPSKAFPSTSSYQPPCHTLLYILGHAVNLPGDDLQHLVQVEPYWSDGKSQSVEDLTPLPGPPKGS